VTDPGLELVEVVDLDGNVVEVTTRADVRAGNLRHRCTYVGVVTGDDALVVHQRAHWKDVYPGAWDVCFGGICSVGEDWVTSARRELVEEAGLLARSLIELGPVVYEGDDGRMVGRVYLVRSDDAITCPDGEVIAVDRVPLADLDQWLADHRLCPDSEQLALPLMRHYLAKE